MLDNGLRIEQESLNEISNVCPRDILLELVVGFYKTFTDLLMDEEGATKSLELVWADTED